MPRTFARISHEAANRSYRRLCGGSVHLIVILGVTFTAPRAPRSQLPGVAWLAFTVVAKAHVDRVASGSLPPPGAARVFTTPTPLNAVLWRVVAMTGDGRYLEGYYSLLDPEPRVSFVSRPDGHELLEPLRGEAAVARLMWFSRGFFSGRELGSGEVVISDLRMGLEERPVFSFVVGRRGGEAIEPAPVRRRPDPEVPSGLWAALGERILGRSAQPACLLPC